MAMPKRRARSAPLILQNNERQYPLSDLAKLLPNRPHRNTLVAWCLQGSMSDDGSIVRMEYVFGPGIRRRCRMSTVEAWQRFRERLNGYIR
jgi:hypothetical protein